MLNVTPTLLTDGYKIDHLHQIPKETTCILTNGTPRKSRVKDVDHILWCGLQPYLIGTLIEIWNEHFFKRDIEEISAEFMEEMTEYTLSAEMAKKIGTDHWRALHKLGYLPLEIKALPEGTFVPIGVPCYTIKPTNPDFVWLGQFIESDLSCETWPTTTSATTAFQYYKIFTKWAIKTGGDRSFVKFQGHDFSYRGMMGRMAAALSGMGHLFSFYGTDTLPAIKALKKYYNANVKDDGIIGCSVFATEHAVMCTSTGFYILSKNLTWEKYGEAEVEVYRRLITEVYPEGIISIVSDTWDLWRVLCEYNRILKAEIMARNGKVVFRPDSGDPCDIICGLNTGKYRGQFKNEDSFHEFFTSGGKSRYRKEEWRGVVEILWDIFGGTMNVGSDGKLYRQLDPHVGAIYGDSITTERAEEICQRLADKEFCSTNWVAGIGSYSYQYVTRDTYGWALKATYAEFNINGVTRGIDLFKDPVTDDGTKKSARGLIAVMKAADTGKLTLKQECTWEEEALGELVPVFRNSELLVKHALKSVRSKVDEQLEEYLKQ